MKLRGDAADKHYAVDDAGACVFAGASSSPSAAAAAEKSNPISPLRWQTQPESSISTAVMMLLKITLPIGVAGVIQPQNYNRKPLNFTFFSVNVANLIIDRVCYGYWVIPALNFVKFNVFQNGSAFYGTNPIYWYIVAGVPAVLLTSLILVLIGIKQSKVSSSLELHTLIPKP